MTVAVVVTVLAVLGAGTLAGAIACLSAQRGISLRAEREQRLREQLTPTEELTHAI